MKLSSLFVLLLFVPHIWAGQAGITVTGTVTDHTGDVLPGVNIVVDGSAHGVVSDIGGRYSITVPDENAVLVFSSVGCVTQEIIVGDQTVIDVTMTEDSQQLDEVVVVGYGTQKRKELTGSVASVSKSILEHPAVSLDAMLGGAIAGVSVAQTSGQPGAASTIRIRGGNSVTANNDPLYVIDGFIFYSDNASTKAGLNGIEGNLNPLAAINPSDIESIEVLKDVSATAIYGSRGANGVIIVTTKKGTRGAGNVSYQYTIGWDKPAKKLDLLNAQQWARMQKDFFFNKPGLNDEQIVQLGEGYNWQNAVLQTGVSQTHELTVNGGTDKLRYLVSGNYTDQNGIIINSGFQRYNGRVNLDWNITDKFTVGVTATVGKSTQNSLTVPEAVNFNGPFNKWGISNSLTYALYMPPMVPVYDANGGYNYHNPFEYGDFVYDGKTVNPVSDLHNSTGQTINTTILGNFYASYTLLPGLTAKVSAGTHISHITQNFFAPKSSAIGLVPFGIGGIGNKQQRVSQTEYTLTYSKRLNRAHYIDLLAGYTAQDTKMNYATNLTSDFTNETLGFNNLADGSTPYPPVSGVSESKLYSLLGRVNYSLLGRYNLTATIRGDKSTRFAKNHRWGYFPSVGVSWNVSEEAFLRDVSTLSNLKLRVTCGTVGNQEIGDYEYAQTFGAIRYGDGIAYKQTNLGNKNLKWETTVQYNVGVDVGLFNNRLTFIADGYHKRTTDLLLAIPVDSSLGGGTQLINVGNVSNRGVEFAVNATVVERQRVKWTVSANIAYNINKIVSIGNREPIKLAQTEQIIKTGEPLGSFYGMRFDGIVQQDENIALLPHTAHSPAKPGDIKLADVSGPNGTPDDNVDDIYDRVTLGSNQPNITYGFSTTVNYRGFDLFISTQGAQGNKIYNHLRRRLETPNDIYNASAALIDSWTENKPSNTLPGLQNISNNRYYSYMDSRYVEDASFLKLKNITLGYTLKPQFVAAQLRVFASVQNLFVITRYKGYDPEVASGVDLGTYPTARTFSVGARVTF
ncbi:SusC/RagA family TonB-linked outer membrane protein [Bacteroidia bacterium]|nr:SusC/RagA family TonB-linked outer membrane protein [Bacteroidia bacterium]